jgi:hypothetical protein
MIDSYEAQFYIVSIHVLQGVAKSRPSCSQSSWCVSHNH